MLLLQLVAGVSGAARAYSLQVEDVSHVDEVSGCQLLKSGPVPSSLCSARFHQSPSFISLCDSHCDTSDKHLTTIVVITGSVRVI